MSEKNWITFEAEANGFKTEANFSEEAVNNIFLPFLKKLTEVYGQVGGRKVIAYLVGPPGVGKTITAQYLEHLSKEHQELTTIRAIGIDGFHFTNDYMNTHFVTVDGTTIPMKMIKGAPETFDLDAMQSKIREVKQEEADWPIYDRNIHDIVPDAISVESEIILIEGNYMLLKDPRWTNIRTLADYTAFIKAEPEMLKTRLIERKVRGGSTQEAAEQFYQSSDSRNVNLVLNNSAEADETWTLEADGNFTKEED